MYSNTHFEGLVIVLHIITASAQHVAELIPLPGRKCRRNQYQIAVALPASVSVLVGLN